MSSYYDDPVFRDRDDDHERSKDILVRYGLTKYFSSSAFNNKGVDYDALIKAVNECCGDRSARDFAYICGFSESVLSRLSNKKNRPVNGLSAEYLLQIFAHRQPASEDSLSIYSWSPLMEEMSSRICISDGYRYDPDEKNTTEYCRILHDIFDDLEAGKIQDDYLSGLRYSMVDWPVIGNGRISKPDLCYTPSKESGLDYFEEIMCQTRFPMPRGKLADFMKDSLLRLPVESEIVESPFLWHCAKGFTYLADFAVRAVTPLVPCRKGYDIPDTYSAMALHLYKFTFADFAPGRNRKKILEELFRSQAFILTMKELIFQRDECHKQFCYDIVFPDEGLWETAKEICQFSLPFPVNFIRCTYLGQLNVQDYVLRVPDPYISDYFITVSGVRIDLNPPEEDEDEELVFTDESDIGYDPEI